MSGRPKKKCYQYDLNGKFIKTYDCIEDIRKEYYPNDIGKRPIFVKENHSNRGKIYVYNRDYHLLPDNTVLHEQRVGRDAIRLLIKKLNSKFTNIPESEKIIYVYNLDNKIIASFKGIQVASKMSGISAKRIWYQVTKGEKTPKSDLIFRYNE